MVIQMYSDGWIVKVGAKLIRVISYQLSIVIHTLHITYIHIYLDEMSFNDLERGQSSQPLLRGGATGMYTCYYPSWNDD